MLQETQKVFLKEEKKWNDLRKKKRSWTKWKKKNVQIPHGTVFSVSFVFFSFWFSLFCHGMASTAPGMRSSRGL
jgi:hypothetical protein